MNRQEKRSSAKRRSGVLSDLFNVVVFLLALALFVALVSVLDPTIKNWIIRIFR